MRISLSILICAVMVCFVFFAGCGDDGNPSGATGGKTYAVAVVGGTGGGEFAAGGRIRISADVPTGMQFDVWTSDKEVEFSDAKFRAATFVMPSSDVTITATFKPIVRIDPATVISGTITDPRDDQVYNIVTIGNQTWLAENINFKTPDSSWCFDRELSTCDKQIGRLYGWSAAKQACDGLGDGWRLPSGADWTTLVNAVGDDPGTKLKSDNYWGIEYSAAGFGTNDYGFTAVPSGYRNDSAGPCCPDCWGRYWSSTDYSTNSAYFWMITYDRADIQVLNSDKRIYGYSARCVSDK